MGLNPNQQKIVDTLHASVNVAAGAGTGKTFTLTKRTTACVQDILAQDQSDQVCSVNPIERILEITFTEKAAAELKSRVRSELFEVAKQSEDARILEAALDADNAWISTIHAMCSRILKENALAFGLDPAFEVLDNAESNSIFVTAAEDILDDFRAASYPYADELLDAYPLSLGAQVVGGKSGSFSKKDLISIVRDLFGKVDYMPKGLDGVVSLEARLDPHELFRMMLEAVSEFPQDFDAEGLGNASEAKKAPGYAEEAELAKLAVMDWFEDSKGIHSFADEGFDAQDFMDALLTFPATTNTFGKKSAYAGEFSAYRQTYKWVCAASLAEIGLRSFSGVRSFASLLYERILQLKNEGGTRLDNNDLLKRVAYEFADPKNEAILNKYRRQFEFIMLDEFQDTDKLQMQIVKSLAHDKNELQGEIAFANLCTVGDMQQSIYRFRGGDVEESLARAASLAGVAESTFKLDANYRSHPAVLDAVEMIFSRPNAFGDDFLRLEAGRSDFNPALDDIFTGHDARILFDFVHKKTGRAGSPGVSSEDAKRASAMRIARRFKHIKDAAAASGDAKAQASANSMAILLRTLKNADVYADALRDVGIDSVISGGSVFAEMPEAHLVDFLLKVAVNPADEEPLFNVLTSPLFAVSDTALLMLVYRCKDSSQNAQGATAGVGRHVVGFKRSASLSRAFFDDALMSTALDAVQEEDACSLQIAQACLKDFIECARVKSVSVALRKLFNNSGLLARLQGDDASAAPSAQNISSAANISKAITIVEDLEQNCFGVAQVSDAYSTYLQNEKESPGSLALSGSNFVQIMTIHASKGLEFDHIAVAEIPETQGRGATLLAENIDDSTYVSMAPPPLSLEKLKSDKLSKIKDFTFEEDEDFSLLSVDDIKEKIRNAKCAVELRESLEAYTKAQEMAEVQRIYYVALTRARESAIVEFGASRMPISKVGKTCEYGGVFGDTYYALIDRICGGEDTLEAECFAAAGPVAISRIYLTPENIEEYLGDAKQGGNLVENDNVARSGDASYGNEEEFVVAKYEKSPEALVVPVNVEREGLCSYSSLAAFAHGDAGTKIQALNVVPIASEFEDEEAPNLENSGDADKATALGSAFHTLAQRAIILKADDGCLAAPSKDAIEAQARTFELTELQRQRLGAAIDRWFNSDIAANFFASGHVSAEVPFTVCIPAEQAQKGCGGNESRPVVKEFYLEGEIDALSINEDSAWIIDYKTGGNASEAAEALQKKHMFQAQCYAYALLSAGMKIVRATFVRVEQVASVDGNEPQTVEYNFSDSDAASLQKAIIEAYTALHKFS